MTKCFVCDGEMHDYFVRHESYSELGKTFDRKFIRCERCGLVIDQTLYDMSPEERVKVNDAMLKRSYENDGLQREARARDLYRIKWESKLVYQVLRSGLFPKGSRIVDYGCATGELAQYVNQFIDDGHEDLPRVLPYDKYYLRGEGGTISQTMK